MLIIAIDTSSRKGSIALCRGDGGSFEVLQLTPLAGGTYSARLMPTISSLLEQNRFDRSALNGFVTVSGPGSFTGLRVGLATVKGLCEILRKPLATVSMLEALAVTYGLAGETVLAVLDAGRGEVYAGEYQVGSSNASMIREYITKLADFTPVGISGRLLTPDSPVFGVLRPAHAGIELVDPVQADGIGRIGIRKLMAGEVADPARVDVNYIRRSDAEIFSVPGP
ncbi:MAG TPA: tRNA (adenosine(37)-N6)-threonylcarbamoyltransferase complex dimerization subunit type 1 TsaB [Candidatus Binatia bacterium]|nr:tRNA (adenosine(37)-N6)-threonylcarbamoyltransferase complex dimerization subunit type 1 TsaB [Candidatus Binatia bacterium]